MNKIEIFTLKVLRKFYANTIIGQLPPYDRGITDPDKASDVIYNLLASGRPCMIARFGAFELSIILNYKFICQKNHSAIDFIKGKQEAWWWNDKLIKSMCTNAGFFPNSYSMIEKYCKLMFDDIKELDVLESWRPQESLLNEELAHAKRVTAEISAPYFTKRPWSRILRGKKVLVVHPFAKTIEQQYKHRKLLFENQDVLPEFQLFTIPAVQSIGGNNPMFVDWFAALDYMKSEINKVDYDICIIGCGAYGFPLAAHVKKEGKQAVHLAGMTQLLFGIKGARWEIKNNSQKYDYQKLFNDYWVRPSLDERPKAASNVEGGCYW